MPAYHRDRKKWVAMHITDAGNIVELGEFATREEAVQREAVKCDDARLDFHMRRLREKCEERGVRRPDLMLMPFALSRKASNLLSKAEFRQAMKALLLGVAEVEIDALIERFEPDRDGCVTFKEFSRVLEQFAERTAGDWPTRTCEARGPPVPPNHKVMWLELWDTLRDQDETAALSALRRFVSDGGSLDQTWDLWPELAHLPKGPSRAKGVTSSTLPLAASHGHAPRKSSMSMSRVLRTTENTLAHIAAARGFSQFLVELLRAGATCSSPNHDGDTPLTIARLMNHARCVDVLGSEDGTPPLTWDEVFLAIRDESDEIALAKVRAFRQQGARDPWGQDINTKRLERHEWWGFCTESVGYTLAHCAAWKNKPLCLAEILKAEGVDANLAALPCSKRSEIVTPLVLARRLGHATCVSVLTGEPVVQDRVTWTMAWNAIRDEPDETACVKLQRFLEGNERQNLDSQKLESFCEHAGFTLSHLAAAKMKLKCLALLHNAGADLTIREPLSRKTPTELAALGGSARTLPSAPVTWHSTFAKVRDANEDEALDAVNAFVKVGGVDAAGFTIYSTPSGPFAGQTLAIVAAERGFRKVLRILQQHQKQTPPPPAPPRATRATPGLVPLGDFRPDWRRRRPV